MTIVVHDGVHGKGCESCSVALELAARRLRIEDFDFPSETWKPVSECSLVEFLRSNGDDQYAREQAVKLLPGESFDVGGGAAPWYRTTRIA